MVSVEYDSNDDEEEEEEEEEKVSENVMKSVGGMVRRFNLSVISIETFCAITSYEIAVLPQRNQIHSKCDHIIRSKFQLMKEGAPFFSILICQRDVFLNFRCKTDCHIYSLLNHNLLKFNRSYFFVHTFDDIDRKEEKNDKYF